MPATADSRVIVITGANRGLGLEWVKQLSVDPKSFIIATARKPEEATELKKYAGDKLAIVKLDTADIDSFPAFTKEVEALSGGKVDVLINNAGVMIGSGAQMMTGISKSTPQEWIDQYQVNTVGPVFLVINLLPLIEKSTEKKVFNIASMLGDIKFHEAQSYLHYSSYASSKIALTMATLKFQHEFHDKGITFISLSPGWVQTDIAGPGGNSMAPLVPEQSISRMLKFVNSVTPDQSGKFFSLDGIPEAVIA
ncbi:NAD(P)-binding protein [Clavulina sp. PMI_390]|nr:NAD(P)-binding protein [Clavulina sp. PMI_390]